MCQRIDENELQAGSTALPSSPTVTCRLFPEDSSKDVGATFLRQLCLCRPSAVTIPVFERLLSECRLGPTTGRGFQLEQGGEQSEDQERVPGYVSGNGEGILLLIWFDSGVLRSLPYLA